ncbi:MAG: GNAT family N-acetyltransferase [Gammaproteobacteria bacterium]
MDEEWRGTFEIFQTPRFGEIYAMHTGRRRIWMGDLQGFFSSRPLFGNTTLYIHNLLDSTENCASAITACARELKVARVWVSAVRENPHFRQGRVSLLYTAVMDLKKSEEILWQHIGAKTRNMIRRGEKEELKILPAISDRDFSDWWKVYEQTAKSKEFTLQPRALVYAVFKENALAKLFVARKGTETIGGMFFFTHDYPVYWLGGFERVGNYHASHINLWKAMLYFKKNGYAILDLGGVETDESHGPSRFKRAFNGDLKTSWMYRIPINAPKAFILDLAASLYNRN